MAKALFILALTFAIFWQVESSYRKYTVPRSMPLGIPGLRIRRSIPLPGPILPCKNPGFCSTMPGSAKDPKYFSTVDLRNATVLSTRKCELQLQATLETSFVQNTDGRCWLIHNATSRYYLTRGFYAYSMQVSCSQNPIPSCEEVTKEAVKKNLPDFHEAVVTTFSTRKCEPVPGLITRETTFYEVEGKCWMMVHSIHIVYGYDTRKIQVTCSDHNPTPSCEELPPNLTWRV